MAKQTTAVVTTENDTKVLGNGQEAGLDENTSGLPPLKEKEARALVGKINLRTHQLYGHLLELYERQGWKALGYTNFALCAKGELEISTQTAYRWIQIAKDQRQASAMLAPPTTESSQGQTEGEGTTTVYAAQQAGLELGALNLDPPARTGPGRPLGSKNRPKAEGNEQAAPTPTKPPVPDSWRMPLRDLETAEQVFSAQPLPSISTIGLTEAQGYLQRLETIVTELEWQRAALSAAIAAFQGGDVKQESVEAVAE
jgi:hypothetical protein